MTQFTEVQSWSHFVASANELFAGVDDKNSIDDGRYIYGIAALAQQLRQMPPGSTFTNAGLGPGIRTGPVKLPTKQPYFVLKWEFAPGAILPPHDHPNYSFVTLLLSGSMRIQNFEIDGAAPAYDDTTQFAVTRTQDQWLRPGSVNTLTRSRDYVHTLVAGAAGATGIDIGILHTSDVGFSYLEVADGPEAQSARWDRLLTRAVRGK